MDLCRNYLFADVSALLRYDVARADDIREGVASVLDYFIRRHGRLSMATFIKTGCSGP